MKDSVRTQREGDFRKGAHRDAEASSPEHMKNLYEQLRAESESLTDNVKRKDVKNILLVALTEREVENLKLLAEHSGRIKNKGVIVRRLIRLAAEEARNAQS